MLPFRDKPLIYTFRCVCISFKKKAYTLYTV